MQYTEDQQKVIDLRDRNILVSAAAGSGKTAVLVQRIIQKICDETHPVDIDKLLIVTFTSAAAAEMRERISRAVMNKLEEDPSNEHLQKQSALIHNAQITTIDSFCLFLIRNHFHEIDLDPGFRVADEAEGKLLKEDALSELLEECYTEADSEFLYFVECYAPNGSEVAVEEAILRLYHFAISYPWPEEWLQERAHDYDGDSVEELMEKDWFQQGMVMLRDGILAAMKQLETAMQMSQEAGGPSVYIENLQQDMELVGQMVNIVKSLVQTMQKNHMDKQGSKQTKLDGEQEDDFQQIKLEGSDSVSDMKQTQKLTRLSELLQTPFGRLSTKKDPDADPDVREAVKNLRNQVKESLKSLSDQYFPVSMERTIEDMKDCRRVVMELSKLTLSFMTKVDEKKRDKNLVDFSDMEHFALKILLQKQEDGSYVTTDTAKTYQGYFDEVMIDEYQDSNLVQELLLSSVSGEEQGRYNRFMVGDVKQSIYKFRLARPEIFMDKYAHYTLQENLLQRIDLSKNFRSRQEVTDSVNYICSRIMTKSVGNVEYDEHAALYLGANYDAVEDDRYQMEFLIASEDEEETQNMMDALNSINGGAGASQKNSGTLLNNSGNALKDDQKKGNAKTDNKKQDKKDQESVMIAAKIKELVGHLPVRDSETNEMRSAMFKDIVILLRSTVGWDDSLRTVLSEAGIPVHVTSRTGYFQTTEVSTILNMLRVLDNPLQDVALFGTMKSPLYGFTEEEIAIIRAVTMERKSKLFDFVKAYVDGDITPLLEEPEQDEASNQQKSITAEGVQFDPALQQKCADFLESIAHFRKLIAYTPIRELIRTILQETGYRNFVSAMLDGQQRVANVDFLIEQAAAFEQTSYYGLFHFIRYMEEISEQDVDLGEVNILDENADVVRIMTIHKSKGLEFPICFVAGIAKQYNQMDSRKNILLDVDLGIGTDYIDPVARTKRKTLRKNIVKQKMEMDNRGEDLRVLYVALTRAKEKLILTACDNDFEKTLQTYRYALPEESGTENIPAPILKEVIDMDGSIVQKKEYPGILSPQVIMGANNYEKLIIAALGRHPKFEQIVHTYGAKEILEGAITEQITAESYQDALKKADIYQDMSIRNYLKEKFSFVYPHENLKTLTTKTTVSELKKEAYLEQNDGAASIYAEPEPEHYIPKFMQQEEEHVTGSVRGSAYHKVMELLEYAPMLQNASENQSTYLLTDNDIVQQLMKDLLQEGVLTQEYYDSVRTDKVNNFLQSNLAFRMALADARQQLFKEQPFVIGITADRLNPDFPATETVLIQGVIDVFFEEDDQLIVADYKTDAVKTPDELIKRYKTQLDYYAEALEQLLGKPVKQKLIYSFALECEIEC